MLVLPKYFTFINYYGNLVINHYSRGRFKMPPHESWHNVGSKIRFLRKANGLTVKQLAQGSDLSNNTISMVERSEVAPTIETLCKIANALGVSPASLFLEVCKPRVNLQRATTACSPELDGNAAQFLSALPKDANKQQEMIPGNLPTQHHSILCLSGQVELELDCQNFILNPGDNLDFCSDGFHRWHNTSDSAGIIVIVLPPDQTK